MLKFAPLALSLLACDVFSLLTDVREPSVVVVSKIIDPTSIQICGGSLITPQWILMSGSCYNSILSTSHENGFVVSSVNNLKVRIIL